MLKVPTFFFFVCLFVSVEFVDGEMSEFPVEWGQKIFVPCLFALKYIGWIEMKIKGEFARMSIV